MISFEAQGGVLSSVSTRRAVLVRLGIMAIALGCSIFPAVAGDSVYGKIVEVISADVVILDYGAGQYVVHIAGIVPPGEGALADQAKKLVSDSLLGKNARLRIEDISESGEITAQLATADPDIGIKDIGIELLTAGLAQRQPDFDYKYNELSAAEDVAKKFERGLWVKPLQ